MSLDISICGQIHTLFAFCVFDPVALGWCPEGALAGEAYDQYGMIMWNMDRARDYVSKCLESEDGELPQPASLLLPNECSLVEDWLECIETIFTSDFTQPRQVINGLPYLVGLLPTGKPTGTIAPVEIGQPDFLPYKTDRNGYREALIRISGHLIKLKAFQILESKSRSRVRIYSSGDPIIQDWMQQFSYALDGYYDYLKVSDKNPGTTNLGGQNYLLFGASAVEQEERQQHDDYFERVDVESLLSAGAVEYRFDPGMPEEWPIFIEHLAEKARSEKISGELFLSRSTLRSVFGELPENPLGWLNFLTGTCSTRYANWFARDEEGELETKPPRWSLCLDWTEKGSVFVCSLDGDNIRLLKNIKKGEVVQAVETGCPLRITVE